MRNQNMIAGLLTALTVTMAWPAHAAPIEVMGGALKAVWDHGTFSVGQANADRPFLKDVAITENAALSCRVEPIRDPVWGEGEALVVQNESGDLSQVELFKALPFAVLKQTLVNQDSAERIVRKVPMLRGVLDLDLSPESLKTMSTAGLHDVSEHPGGYAFMAIGDPASRKGVVCGWLTHERGSGIVFSETENGQAVLSARIDYGDLRVPANSRVETETLLVGRFEDVRVGLEQYGDAIAKQLDIHLPNQPVVYCTWYHAGASDEVQIAKNADFASTHLAPFGFQVMQIDDKWQAGESKNGPRKDFSKVRSDGPYPSGMKKTADDVCSHGLVPGIWFMPFAGTWNDPYWADKRDLFYKEGRSVDNHIAATNGDKRPDFPKGEAPYVARWGGTCLDMTNPKTQQYLRSIVDRIANKWGFRYFKMDGMWTGTGTRLQYVNSEYRDDDLGQAKRFNPSMTPIEAYRKGLDIVRQTAGPKVFLLGCCAPQNMRSLGPAFGKVDAMRVGPDNGARPSGLVRGPLFSTRVFFLNKRVWYNDPDPVYVRPSFPKHMAQTSVSWTALTGSLHSSSYDYGELPADRLDILERSMPSNPLKTVRPVDFLENDPARIWLLTDDRRDVAKYVVGLFNWDIQKPVRIDCSLDRIGLPAAERYVGFDYWADRFVPPFSGTLTANLLPGGCHILSVRPTSEHPQVVSTSRHVTQGVIDLSDEQWDAASATLTGTSQVIGGTEYELRIVVPVENRSWRLQSAKVLDASSAVPTRFSQTGPTIRVRIVSPHGGSVHWSLRFERGEVAAPAPEPVGGLKATLDLDRVVLNWQSGEGYGYRIRRDSTVIAEQSAMSLVDQSVELGRTYTYTVESRAWTGQWTVPAKVKVQLPEELPLAEVPPTPDVFCSALKPVKASTGFGKLGINQSCMGQPLTVNSTIYENGLGTHASSTLIYRVPKGATRFVASVGIDDEKRDDDRSSILFKVMSDTGRKSTTPPLLARSPVLHNSGIRLWHFDVPLDERPRDLHLIVDDAGDGKAADHADWLNAGFLLK